MPRATEIGVGRVAGGPRALPCAIIDLGQPTPCQR